MCNGEGVYYSDGVTVMLCVTVMMWVLVRLCVMLVVFLCVGVYQ